MQIKFKFPSVNYEDYTLSDEMKEKVAEAISKSGTVYDGKIYINENVINVLRLTPRHISENFEDVEVELNWMD